MFIKKKKKNFEEFAFFFVMNISKEAYRERSKQNFQWIKIATNTFVIS